MRPRSAKEHLIADSADRAAGDENLGLRRELERLDARLADDENWRALSQLDEREARGEPLQAVAGDKLRGALRTRLSSNRFYLARVKIADALAILDGGSASAPQVEAQAEMRAGVSAQEPAEAVLAPRQPSRANAFRTNLKIKSKAPSPDAVPLAQIAAGWGRALPALASAATALPSKPQEDSTARPARGIGLRPVAPDARSPVTPDAGSAGTPVKAKPLPAAPAQVANDGRMPVEAPFEPEQAKPEQVTPEQVTPEQAKPEQVKPERALSVPARSSVGMRVAPEAETAVPCPEAAAPAEEDTSGIAGLRQIAAWRHADVLRARGVDLRGNEEVPALLVPSTDLTVRQPALVQHALPFASLSPLAQLNWIKGIDGELARQLEARGVGDQRRGGVGDQRRGGVGDQRRDGVGDQRRDGVGDQRRDGVGDPRSDGVGGSSKDGVGGLRLDAVGELCADGLAGADAAAVSTALTGFAQISRWDAADVAKISAALQLGNRPSAENWIEQAACLASGRMTRYAMRVAAGETAAVVAAPKQVAAPFSKPKALRKPVCSIPVAAAGEGPQVPSLAPSPNGTGATPSSYTGDFLSQPHRAPPVQPQAIPPVFETLPRAEMGSAFDLRQSASRPDNAAEKTAEEPESGNESGRASAFVPVPRGDPATASTAFSSSASDPVAASTDADPFGNLWDRHLRRDLDAQSAEAGDFEQEAEVVIVARDDAAPAADSNGSPQFDETASAAPVRIAAPAPRRENRIESHAAYHTETDEASVVIVSRDEGDEAPDLAFYKQNEHWEREGTIRKFLKALTGD